jgi:hypothetical protein
MPTRLAFSCLALAVLAACNRGNAPAPMIPTEPAELTWARAALERNPQIEVLASDPQTRVFTVRDRNSGAVSTVNLNDLAAAPLSQLKAQAAAPASAPAPTAAPSEPSAPARESTTAQPAQVAAAPSEQPAPLEQKNYTIERSGGQLRVSGPGVSIVSAGTGRTTAAPNTTGTRTVEPIICEGKRMLHIDDRNIYVEGDAIIARGGCELYITNSRIIASGTGLVVEDAIVHVANSHIEGVNSSFTADDRAKMFVRTSTFQGVPRRAEFAMVKDQGGNQYR